MNSNLLSINGLTVGMKDQPPVLRELSLTMKAGEVAGLAGESGCGKSMLARTICRLEPKYLVSPRASIFFDSPIFGSIDLLKLEEGSMTSIRGKEIAMIFQEPKVALNPVYTCGFQSMEMAMTHVEEDRKIAQEKVREVFASLDLRTDIFDSYPYQISGGEAQRVMIAMATLSGPRLLIADEPTTSLDKKNELRIIEILMRLKEEHNMGILLVSHDYSLINSVSERSWYLRKGKLSPADENKFSYAIPDRTTASTIDEQKKVILAVDELSYSVSTSGILSNGRQNETAILQSLQFKCYEDETLGIIGDSGSGKTTLARCILKLISPKSGSINFNGMELTRITSKQLKILRRDIQIVFQDPLDSLNPRMTMRQALTEPLRVHKIYNKRSERSQAIQEMLEKVGLKDDLLQRYPHQLSGGERQRFCLARVLLLKPKLVILDEPVTSLDYSRRFEILQLLEQLKKEFNLTYIFISHDIGLINFMTDRVVVIKEGRVLEEGHTSVVLNDPSHEYTASLLNVSLKKGKKY